MSRIAVAVVVVLVASTASAAPKELRGRPKMCLLKDPSGGTHIFEKQIEFACQTDSGKVVCNFGWKSNGEMKVQTYVGAQGKDKQGLAAVFRMVGPGSRHELTLTCVGLNRPEGGDCMVELLDTLTKVSISCAEGPTSWK